MLTESHYQYRFPEDNDEVDRILTNTGELVR